MSTFTIHGAIVHSSEAAAACRQHYETYFPLVILARSEGELTKRLLDHVKQQLGESTVAELTEEAEDEDVNQYIMKHYENDDDIEIERFTKDI